MAKPFAEWLDVEGRWAGKSFTSDEKATATNLLGDASAMVRNDAPAIDGRIALFAVDHTSRKSIDPELVKAIVATMVKRLMTNPAALRQFARSIDDHTQSGTYDPAGSAVELYLTDREAKLLGIRTGGRAFTISPSPVAP